MTPEERLRERLKQFAGRDYEENLIYDMMQEIYRWERDEIARLHLLDEDA